MEPSELAVFLADPGHVGIGGDYDFIGVYFLGKEAKEEFWRVTCPCGKTDTFPLNKLPEVDTPHSCGNPKHWAVRYSEEATDAI